MCHECSPASRAGAGFSSDVTAQECRLLQIAGGEPSLRQDSVTAGWHDKPSFRACRLRDPGVGCNCGASGPSLARPQAPPCPVPGPSWGARLADAPARLQPALWPQDSPAWPCQERAPPGWSKSHPLGRNRAESTRLSVWIRSTLVAGPVLIGVGTSGHMPSGPQVTLMRSGKAAPTECASPSKHLSLVFKQPNIFL